ncbi:MAG TPA: LuxR C-terminal-related transcriptional regulator [Blastocatellia bacterium]|nr:LuxR C-terminal-related transcriptional regulator [Blastocatellia bacterium]
MSIPVLTTKVSIPPLRHDWVLRPRLIKQLDQGLERKLTLVSAPAGFGKTTLVSSWLHGLEDRLPTETCIAWLSLEEDDNGPIRFLTHFIAALQRVNSGVGQTVQALLELPRIPKLTHLMTLLINDLAALQWQIVLVLDDYHVITHPDLQNATSFFLEHLPSHCHVIMATREEPTLPLARWRAQWEVLEIRLQDLRFTGEETTTFLNWTMGLTLAPEIMQSLEERTEGWIAGLQIAALSLRGQEQSPRFDHAGWDIEAFSGGHRYIIDYLAAEVLRQQPAELRAFLRQTAILDRFNASLCDSLTGRDDSQLMLAQLEKANLFLIPLDDERHWYRYHHLFADFLRTDLTCAEQIALHRGASQWFEQEGLASEAIKHALAAQDGAMAVRLIRNHAEETLRLGGFNTILGWVNALPDEVVRKHSDLSAHKAWILYLQGEIASATLYATLATENDRPEDPPVQRGMLLSFRSYLALHRGQPEQAVKLAEEALVLLGETDSFYRTTALSHLGQGQRFSGDREAAIRTLRETIALGQRLGNHLITLEALGYLTILLYQQGHLCEAILLNEQTSRRYLDDRGQPLPAAGLVYVWLGMLYYETNDLTQADHYLTTGLALCQQMGIIHPVLLGFCTLAKLYCVRGETAAMWETLGTARQLAARTENMRLIRLVSAVAVELQLRQGLTAAAALTLADLPIAARDGSEQGNLSYARLLLAQGQAEAARNLLLQLEQFAQQEGRRGSLITIHLLQTLAHKALNRTTAAVDCLERAICLAAPEGYRRAFLDESPTLAALLPYRQDVAPDFVAALMEAFAKDPLQGYAIVTAPELKASSQQLQPLVEPLSETQLMVLRLVADGLSNRDIAAKLDITEGTTKWHLNQIYGKLNVCSRTQAVAHARQLKLI